MPTDVDKLIEAGHDINSFGPAVLAQLVSAKILTVNEARRALRLPPMSYQEAGEKVLYNGGPGPETKVIPQYTAQEANYVAMAQALGVPPEQLYNEHRANARPLRSEAPPVEETPVQAPQAHKQVYRPTTPPKRGRPVKARPALTDDPRFTSKYKPDVNQVNEIRKLATNAGLTLKDLDELTIQQARNNGGSDARFVTGYFAISWKIAGQLIDELKQINASSAPDEDEEMPAF